MTDDELKTIADALRPKTADDAAHLDKFALALTRTFATTMASLRMLASVSPSRATNVAELVREALNDLQLEN